MNPKVSKLEMQADSISLKECTYTDMVSKIIWSAGFRAGYLYEKPEEEDEITPNKKQRKEHHKSVDVFKKGICISRNVTMQQASILANISYSRVCHLTHTKQKSKSGYYFKPGKL